MTLAGHIYCSHCVTISPPGCQGAPNDVAIGGSAHHPILAARGTLSPENERGTFVLPNPTLSHIIFVMPTDARTYKKPPNETKQKVKSGKAKHTQKQQQQQQARGKGQGQTIACARVVQVTGIAERTRKARKRKQRLRKRGSSKQLQQQVGPRGL